MKRTYKPTQEEIFLNTFYDVLHKEDFTQALVLWEKPAFTQPLKQKAMLALAGVNPDTKPQSVGFLLNLDPTLIQAHIPEPFWESGNVLHAAILNGWRMEVEQPTFELFLQYGVDLEFRKQGPTEWREDAAFEGEWGDGRTPLLECAMMARYSWIPMLLDAGANPNAVDDAGLNFLDIFRAWSGKMIQRPEDAEKTLAFWLATDVGQQQMLLQAKNPEHLKVFQKHYPFVMQAWVAKQEQHHFQTHLPDAQAPNEDALIGKVRL